MVDKVNKYPDFSEEVPGENELTIDDIKKKCLDSASYALFVCFPTSKKDAFGRPMFSHDLILYQFPYLKDLVNSLVNHITNELRKTGGEEDAKGNGEKT